MIYYIGKSILLKSRISYHVRGSNSNLKDRFHLFAKLVGPLAPTERENFTISVVEFTRADGELHVREKYYLDKYLPALNTIFASSSEAGVSKASEQVLYKNIYKLFLTSKQNTNNEITRGGDLRRNLGI